MWVYSQRSAGEEFCVIRRILLVSVTPFFGGGEVHFVKLVRLLSERYHVRALVVSSEAAQRLHDSGLDVVKTPCRERTSAPMRYINTAWELLHQIRTFRPQIVHLNGQGESYLSSIPWLLGVPIICTRHVPFNEHIRGIRRLLVVINLCLANHIVCVSSLLRTQLSKVVSPDKLVVIPNWLDPAPDPVQHMQNGTGKPFRILFVGRIETIKGIFDLIEAMRQVKNATLDVVGTGSQMDAARSAAAGLPITFHGFQADCGPYYRAANLLVFPSHPDLEGQGQVPFEAMAHGLPCLISDIEVALETADNGACAEVFPCGNSAEMARKITCLQSDPARLEELRSLGLARFLSTYTVDSIREPYFQLFDSLMPQKTEQPS